MWQDGERKEYWLRNRKILATHLTTRSLCFLIFKMMKFLKMEGLLVSAPTYKKLGSQHFYLTTRKKLAKLIINDFS